MSVGPGTHTAATQRRSQSTAGPDPPQHSALFYLFQEVSKLASPVRSACVDADSPCPWLKEDPLQGSLSAGAEERVCSSGISEHSASPHRASHKRANVTGRRQDGKTTPESHSPWKVLSLINLQCKRLLHHSDAEEHRPNVSLSSSPLASDRLSKAAAAKVTGQEVGSDCPSSTFRSSVLKCEGDETASRLSADDAVMGTGAGSHPQGCVKESREDLPQSESAGTPDTAHASSHFHHEQNKEDKFNSNRLSHRYSEQAEEFLSTKEAAEHLSSGNTSKNTNPAPNDVLNSHLTSGQSVEAVVFLMKPEFPLDCNANLCLPIEAAREHVSWAASPSAAHPRIITDRGPPPVQRGDSRQGVTGARPGQQISNPQTNPSKHVDPKLEGEPGQKKDAAGAATQPWRAKTLRKQPRPSRSVNIHDPDLHGVMFRMDPELDDSKEHCRLLITSEYR